MTKEKNVESEVKVEKIPAKKGNFSSILKNIKGSIANFIKNLKKIKINKNILKYSIVGIVVILLVFGLGNMIFKDNNINYPVIFNNSEGDLYLLNSKASSVDDSVKLAVGEAVSNAKYANTTDRYVLFKKSNDLYLYDAKLKEETVKIAENVKNYTFSLDDKYIVILDNDDNLNVYNYKTTIKMDSDVSEIVAVSEDKVVFEKDSVIYVRGLTKKDDRYKVTAEYGSNLKFSEDGKNIVYLNKDNDLIKYNTKKNKDEKLASNVKNYYCDLESCNTLFYLASGDTKVIYYYDGKKESKVAEGIYSILTTDLEYKQIVYSTTKDGKYTIHYQTVGKDAITVEEDLTSIRTLKIYKGKEIYYITGKNEVKYAKINNNSIDKPKSLGADVTGYLYVYKDGYAFVSDVDSKSNGTLYLAKGGKAKKIDNNVNSSLLTTSKDGNRIYYFKDYDVVGTLYVTSGSKNTKIDENVYTFAYINDDLLYYIKDYSNAKARGDLFIYNHKKARRVSEGVSRIASSPVSFKLK